MVTNNEKNMRLMRLAKLNTKVAMRRKYLILFFCLKNLISVFHKSNSFNTSRDTQVNDYNFRLDMNKIFVKMT